MPTIYTENKLGKDIEANYYGTQGVYTGGAANANGLRAYEHKKRLQQMAGVVGAQSGSPGRQSYRMLPLFQSAMDVVPRWLYVILALTGGACGYAFSGVHTSGAAAPYLAIGLGAFTGWIIFPLTIALTDFLVQLTWFLTKLALFFGVIAAVIWGITRLLG